MSFYSTFYGDKYKTYLIAPIILAVIILVLVFVVGPKESIDLTGGTQLSVYTKTDLETPKVLEMLQAKFDLKDLSVTISKGASENRIDIQYKEVTQLTELKSKIDAIKQNPNQNKGIEDTKLLLESYKADYANIKDQEYKTWMSQLDILYNNQKNKVIENILSTLNSEFGIDVTNTTINEIAPVLGSAFYSKAIGVVVAAIILIVIVVFLFFREFIPSVAIIACGVFDVLGGLAGMVIFGIPFSMVSIIALLMLLGYSIDTDILLTTKLIKRSDGSARERCGDAMRTGIYMTTTTLAALIAMLVVAKLYNIGIFFDIAVIILSGLVVDLIATWMMNAPILLWYVENKKSKQ